jgi:hypothetical protein
VTSGPWIDDPGLAAKAGRATPLPERISGEGRSVMTAQRFPIYLWSILALAAAALTATPSAGGAAAVDVSSGYYLIRQTPKNETSDWQYGTTIYLTVPRTVDTASATPFGPGTYSTDPTISAGGEVKFYDSSNPVSDGSSADVSVRFIGTTCADVSWWGWTEPNFDGTLVNTEIPGLSGCLGNPVGSCLWWFHNGTDKTFYILNRTITFTASGQPVEAELTGEYGQAGLDPATGTDEIMPPGAVVRYLVHTDNKAGIAVTAAGTLSDHGANAQVPFRHESAIPENPPMGMILGRVWVGSQCTDKLRAYPSRPNQGHFRSQIMAVRQPTGIGSKGE